MAKKIAGTRVVAGLAFLLAFLRPSNTGATSFVAVYHNRVLYVGGDTLVVDDKGRWHECKISVDSKYLVIAAGLGGVTHPDHTKDMFRDRTAAIFKAHLPPKETIEKLREAAKAIIEQSGHPSDEDKLIQLYWFSDDDLWVKLINVRRTLRASGPDEPAAKMPEAGVFPGGHPEAFNALFHGHYDLPYQAVDRPKEVGGPLTIVEFSPHRRPVWDDPKHYCSNQ